MIYDHLLTVCTPPEGWGKPSDGPLARDGQHFYGERTVYHRRFWEAQTAGTRVDRMVQVPEGYEIMASSYVLLEDDARLYRIEEAQHTTDEDGLPVTNLTLRRMEANYDICKPEDLT